MADRILFSIFGFFGALGVPFSWLLWRAFSVRRTWWMNFLNNELSKHYEVYVCLAAFAMAVFTFIGYWIGKSLDDRRELSKMVEDSNYALNHLASTDGLTGLFNSRYIHDRLDIEVETTYRAPLSCLLIDIDYFKRINDGYGHPFGDEVLVAMAQILKRSVRRIDIVGRLGGEEFIVLLLGTSSEKALEVANRVRKAVDEEPFLFEGKPVHVTVSVGLVTYPDPNLQYRYGLLKAVDEALYSAKRAGRNRVVVWSPSKKDKKAA